MRLQQRWSGCLFRAMRFGAQRSRTLCTRRVDLIIDAISPPSHREWTFLRLPSAAHLRDGRRERKMERETGFEPATSTLARSHSTTELFPPVQNRKRTTADPARARHGPAPAAL